MLDISVIDGGIVPCPLGVQLTHTPLGPIVAYVDAGAPPALSAALNALFPTDNFRDSDPPPPVDETWVCTAALLRR